MNGLLADPGPSASRFLRTGPWRSTTIDDAVVTNIVMLTIAALESSSISLPLGVPTNLAHRGCVKVFSLQALSNFRHIHVDSL
jgi:hypothetical protein